MFYFESKMEIFQIGLEKSLFLVIFLTQSVGKLNKNIGFKGPSSKDPDKGSDWNIYCLGKNLTEKYIALKLTSGHNS